MMSINPEDRIIETVADAVSSYTIRDLHHPAYTKRAQRRVLEDGGMANVRNSNAGVVNHSP
jgi:hypothetical protein